MLPIPPTVPAAWRHYMMELEWTNRDLLAMNHGLGAAVVVLMCVVAWLFVSLLRERKVDVRDPSAWTPVQYTAAAFVRLLNVAMVRGPDAAAYIRTMGCECGVVALGDVVLISSVRSLPAVYVNCDEHELRRRVIDDVACGNGVALRTVSDDKGTSFMRMTTAEFDNWRSGRDPHAE